MKEKRVDAWLSMASLLQLMFLGFGGSFGAELMKPHSDEIVMLITSLIALILIICIIYVYLEVHFLTKG